MSLGLAALLPVIVFVAVEVLFAARNDRQEVKADALARAKEVMLHVDSQINSDVAFLRLMTTSSSLEAPDLAAYYMYGQRALRSMPQLITMILWDARTHQQVFDLRQPYLAANKSAWPFDQMTFYADQVVIGGVETQAAASPVIYMHYPVMHEQQLRFVISIALDAKAFQNILLTYSSNDAVSAIVDRSGKFIARTIHYQQRFGTPATVFVRDAIASGAQGFYEGVTYEGIENHSAFYKSTLSGWSAHIAVSSADINGMRWWSLVVAGLAALGTVLLAGVLIVLVLRDMDERRRAEETLRQSQKMEAVGQLTGGIAHDFNNLLTAMIGGLDLIVRRTADNERVHKFAVNALAAAHRGAKLTSQLLAFSRNQKLELISVDLRALLDSMSELLLRAVGPAIHLKVDITSDARYVMSDPIQLEFALLNLAANARDAMPNGGEFSITSAVAEKQFCATLPPCDYVQIAVADNGAGMAEEVRRRALEPFFTTKSVGAGTGLGLSQVFGMMRQSNGTLHLVSKLGAGTQLYLILPAAQSPPPTHGSMDIEPEAAVTAASILVVDDDQQVRKVVVEALRMHGYRVAEAENGARALSIMADVQPKLLLIDFAMPGANGVDIARVAKQRYPQLNVLVMSGYADTGAIYASIGNVPLLRKPFDIGKLRRAVAEALNYQTGN